MRPVSALFRAVLAAIIVFSSGTGFSARHAYAQVPSAAFGGAATAAAGSPASVEAAKLDPSGGGMRSRVVGDPCELRCCVGAWDAGCCVAILLPDLTGLSATASPAGTGAMPLPLRRGVDPGVLPEPPRPFA